MLFNRFYIQIYEIFIIYDMINKNVTIGYNEEGHWL